MNTSNIERIQKKIDSCYKCIEANKSSILFYKKQQQDWNVAQLEKENIEIRNLIKQEIENLNFERDTWVKHDIRTPKARLYKKFPRELSESESIDMLERLNWK